MWTEEQLRANVAFWVEFNVDPKYKSLQGATMIMRVYFNCLGEPMRVDRPPGLSSDFLAQYAPGAEKYYPKYSIGRGHGRSKAPGMIQDGRSLHMMLNGCCPEEAEIAQMGETEIGD